MALREYLTQAQRVDELANEFIKTIQRWLGPQDCELVDERNRAEEDDRICHTHDFCDANMAMDEAYENLWRLSPNLRDEAVQDEWSDAWMLAKARGFATTPTISAIVTKLTKEVDMIKRLDDIIALREIEADLRAASTKLWVMTVDDPETATAESEKAGMTPEREVIHTLRLRLDSITLQIESLINSRPVTTLNGSVTSDPTLSQVWELRAAADEQCDCDEPERETCDGCRTVFCVACGGDS